METYDFYFCPHYGAPTNISDLFTNKHCIEGNRLELMSKIKANTNFCRGQMDVTQLSDCVRISNSLYIQTNTGDILGAACIVFIEKTIYINYLCVPENKNAREKNYIGTLLLNKLKEICSSAGIKQINLMSLNSSIGFYKKNRFKEGLRNGKFTNMYYNF